MSLDAILAECELEPRLTDILNAEAAAALSLARLRSPGVVLFDSGKPCEVWIRPAVEPPLEVALELLVKVWGSQAVFKGRATRRFLNGAVTFWIRHNGRCRCVRPIGWRAKA